MMKKESAFSKGDLRVRVSHVFLYTYVNSFLSRLVGLAVRSGAKSGEGEEGDRSIM